MIRTLLICAVISASACGCASQAPRPDAPATAAAAQQWSPQLGSRIPSDPLDCANPAKRSYSETDIQNTGQTNVADALGMLDPSITVHH